MGDGPFFPEGSSTLERIAAIGALQQQFGPRAAIGTPQFVQEQFRGGRAGIGEALRSLAIAGERRRGREAEAREAEQLRARQEAADRLVASFRPSPPAEGPTREAAAAAAPIPVEAQLAQQAVIAGRPQDAARILQDLRARQTMQSLAQVLQQTPGIDPARAALVGQVAQSGAPIQNLLPFLLTTAGQEATLGQRRQEFAAERPMREQAAQTRRMQAQTAAVRAQTAQQEAAARQTSRQAMRGFAQELRQEAVASGQPPSRFDRMLIAGLESGDPAFVKLATATRSGQGVKGAMRNEFLALGLNPDDPNDVRNPANMQRALKEQNQRAIERQRAQLIVAQNLPIPPEELGNWINPTTLSAPSAGGNLGPRELAARGFILMDPKSQNTLRVAQQAQTILSDITALALGGNREMSDGRRIQKGAFENIPAGIFSRAFRGAVLSFQKVAETHAGAIAKEFEQEVDAYLSLFGRAIAAETGRFTDKDAERIKGAFPTTGQLTFTGPRFPNSTAFAMDRLRLLQAHLDDIRNRAIAFNAMGQFQIGAQGPERTPIPLNAPQAQFSTTPSGTQFRILP